MPDDIYTFPIVAGVVWLIISVFIWMRADIYAARMMPDDREPVTSSEVDAEDVLSIGSGVIGIWICGPALVALANLWTEIIYRLDSEKRIEAADWFAMLLPKALPIVIGVAFLLGSRGLAKFVFWARSAGTRPIERSDAPEEEQP